MLNSDLEPRKYFLRIVVSAIFWIIHGSLHAKGVKISCHVPSVRLHEDTSLTCFLPEDVGQTKKDFTVYKYRDTGIPDAVLDCWWLSGNLDCFVASGYKFDKKISNNLSLMIPRVSAPHVGTYACQVAGYPSDLINLCDLNIFSEFCEIPSVLKNSQTALTCYFPEDLRKTRTDFSISHHSTLGLTETVLQCNWEADILSCGVLSGYVFDNKVTSHLTLSIPEALEDYEGTYSCHTDGSVSVPFNNCSFSLKKGKMSTCSVASVHEMESTTLTCNFSADISRTHQDVNVIHFDQKNKSLDVLNCLWENDELFCLTALGYEFHNITTNYLFITIPRATPDHIGAYSCHLKGVQIESSELCHFTVKTGVSLLIGSFIVVTIAGIIVMFIPLTLIIVFIILNRRSRIQREMTVAGEDELMLSKTTPEIDETTKTFLSFLSKEFQRMYPEYKTKSYVVPLLYININSYKTVNFAGQNLFVTQPTAESILRHNTAMHRVLRSLRLLTKNREEVMFVITQFNYDHYLTSINQEFFEHKLPKLPKSREKDHRYGNFDVLIVHRKHGVLVGVVKACGETEDENGKNKIIAQLEKGCKQLDDAEILFQHLLSDQKHKIRVHKLLILPEIYQKFLSSIFDNNKYVAEIVGKCTGCLKTAHLYNYCLCADVLRGGSREQQIRDWFSRRFSRTDGSVFAKDDQYVAILSRFCGPATSWSLTIPGDHQSRILPTTNADSVSLTGYVFNKPILQNEQMIVLNEAKSLVFLTGPPASGKTRTLVLAGRRWLSEGHKVHVVSTWRKSLAASQILYSELNRLSTKRQEQRSISLVILNDEDVTKRVKRISKLAKKRSLYILADEVGSFDTRNSIFNDFVNGLHKKDPTLHLWAASCFPDIAPQGCQVQVFTNSFTCPPTILMQMEVMQLVSDCGIKAWNPDSRATAPTEGPPVKLVHHGNKDHPGNHPHDCETCADEVETFLRTLYICKKVDCSQMTDASFHLHYKDVMVLFETRVDKNTPLCDALRRQGARVNILDNDDVDVVQSIVQATNDEMLVAEVEHMFGVKKKVVIYVEGGPRKSEVDSNEEPTKHLRWKKLRGLTSATSQLIWVKEIS